MYKIANQIAVLGICASIAYSPVAIAAVERDTIKNGVVSYAASVKIAAPAVVSVQTTREVPTRQSQLMQDPFFNFFFGGNGNQFPGYDNGSRNNRNSQKPPKEQQQGLGSGVIIDDKGHILTNNHVIEGADKIVVKLADGRDADATVIGTDPFTDLAVLKIKLKNLSQIEIGRSEDLEVGDVVLAIGNPFNVGQTVTKGIISAKDRNGLGLDVYGTNFLQTDAAINPGNSGGALIDAYGRLVGINTAIVSMSGGHQGIGFAIPIDSGFSIFKQLASGKKIVRGWLGVYLRELTPEAREHFKFTDKGGVLVQGIQSHSPADFSGILPGDIITKVDKQVINDSSQALKIVSKLQPKKDYLIEVFRRGNKIILSTRVGERDPDSKKS